MEKESIKKLGILLIVLGVVIGLIGLYIFVSSSQKTFSSTGGFDERSRNMQTGFISSGLGIILLFLGGSALLIGIWLIYFASIGKISRYVAGETAPAVETTSSALGRGIRRGWKGK